jgi:hypothetical protein
MALVTFPSVCDQHLPGSPQPRREGRVVLTDADVRWMEPMRIERDRRATREAEMSGSKRLNTMLSGSD